MLDSPGNPFWDPTADQACFNAIKNNIRPDIPMYDLEHNVNDGAFADMVAQTMHALLSTGSDNRGDHT
jgi:uncharacterized protein (UPF0261 family)